MPDWNTIKEEIDREHREAKHPHHSIRQKKLEAFQKNTNHNVVAYYSGWLQKTAPQFGNIVSITDEDKNGLMACFHGLDFEIGLDLILHSPGGSVAATESIIHYIRSKFADDVRVFVPQISMSGGTMIALSGKEIWLGHHSNLGPIDPQFGSQPASLVLSEFDKAADEISKNPDMIHVWRPILEQIPPTFLSTCQAAVDWSREIAQKTLISGMFKDDENKEEKSKIIADALLDVDVHKNHGRHLHRDKCEDIGLKIVNFESDQEMQDLILSVHHSFMITLMESPAAKLIENHKGIIYGKEVLYQN